uniref:GrpE protein homolog 2, mitochondrial n=1 Tax=Peromyscus maniculatus bairdii TaxID=230844 RepID=A0A8C8TR71_PERMB
MAARSLWAVQRLQRLLASRIVSQSWGWLHPFSTATPRKAGEDCSSEDPPDVLSPSLAEQALRLKAVKLEKEVQDLTQRYQRAVADSENKRRRTQRCVEDAKIFGIQISTQRFVYTLVWRWEQSLICLRCSLDAYILQFGSQTTV